MAKFDLITTAPSSKTYDSVVQYYLTKQKINLGCGSDIRDGYLNIDILETPPELCLRADITNLSFLPSESATEILAYDILEHLPFEKVPTVLRGWVRILQRKGKIIVRVPDLELLCLRLANHEIPVFEIQRLIFGSQDHPYNFHMAGFTGDYLEGIMYGSGIGQIIQRIEGDAEDPPSHNVTLVGIK